jgi:hypothetical protein
VVQVVAVDTTQALLALLEFLDKVMPEEVDGLRQVTVLEAEVAAQGLLV